mgnify:CR=1 FL=1
MFFFLRPESIEDYIKQGQTVHKLQIATFGSVTILIGAFWVHPDFLLMDPDRHADICP